jgi:hypothetical protein
VNRSNAVFRSASLFCLLFSAAFPVILISVSPDLTF